MSISAHANPKPMWQIFAQSIGKINDDIKFKHLHTIIFTLKASITVDVLYQNISQIPTGLALKLVGKDVWGCILPLDVDPDVCVFPDILHNGFKDEVVVTVKNDGNEHLKIMAGCELAQCLIFKPTSLQVNLLEANDENSFAVDWITPAAEKE